MKKYFDNDDIRFLKILTGLSVVFGLFVTML